MNLENRPTNDDLAITIETLEYLLEYLNEHEPYATTTIGNLEHVLQEIPREVGEIEIN